MNLQKQQLKEQLKHEHRDEMVQIGIRAVQHALRWIPGTSEAHRSITKYIELVQTKSSTIPELVRQHGQIQQAIANRVLAPLPYTIDTCLIHGTESLLKLSISEKYISGSMLNTVFVGCWNGASCLDDDKMRAEMKYQDDVLRPQIESAFEKLRDQEDKLAA